jgi:hypothetical protein
LKTFSKFNKIKLKNKALSKLKIKKECEKNDKTLLIVQK